EVAEMPVPLRKPIQLMAERVDVAGHGQMQDLLLAPVHEVGKGQPLADCKLAGAAATLSAPLAHEARVDVVERPLVAAVNEQVVDHRTPSVPGFPVTGPVSGQALAGPENLLDDNEEAALTAVGCRHCGFRPVGALGRATSTLQASKVFARIVKPVDVID